ncbi:TPA: hypothetical protein QB274_001484 [Pasteurella multocida]|nr:hypothetical protein [Pasteurella multocida]HDR1195555.1 hypothetical protein [Pasteurella multocida]HDR1266130.1 hypothetical protein [Pasteurella multocida]HED4469407.1 hypothetical protein [Pasteurella multocida]
MVYKPPYDIPPPKKYLSDLDRERIKQAILESASNTTGVPLEEFAESLCTAICLIDSYKN